LIFFFDFCAGDDRHDPQTCDLHSAVEQSDQALDMAQLGQIAESLALGKAESLSPAKQRTAGAAVCTLLQVVEALQRWPTTANTLRKTLGIPEPKRPKGRKRKKRTQDGGQADRADGEKAGGLEAEDETAGAVEAGSDEAGGEEDPPGKEAGPARDEHGRTHPNQYPGAGCRDLTHPEHCHGDQCPECARGRLYERIRSFLSISGQPSYEANVNRVHELQCNFCDAVVKPPIPQELAADGVGTGRRYTNSAAAVTVLEKFLAGTPWHRLEMLQGAYGIVVPDSSMFDMCERVANIAAPVVKVLMRFAANRPVLHADDTGVLILVLRTALRPDRKTGVLVERTGSHTTCILAPGESDIVLYFSGIHHAGEMLDRVLLHRDSHLPPPIVMTDGLAANSVTVCEVVAANCNSHAMRKFKDIKDKYPAEYARVASFYKVIFDNDRATRGMPPDERLRFHQEHSQTAFDQLVEYLKDLDPEPNGDLGKACKYFLNRVEALGRFLVVAGAPLDNNNDERQMRPPVRIRDASRFHRNSAGSGIAAVLLSTIVTALAAGINVFNYLVALQRYAADVAENPERWVPWRYCERIAELEVSAPTDQPVAA
jgi:transposase